MVNKIKTFYVHWTCLSTTERERNLTVGSANIQVAGTQYRWNEDYCLSGECTKCGVLLSYTSWEISQVFLISELHSTNIISTLYRLCIYHIIAAFTIYYYYCRLHVLFGRLFLGVGNTQNILHIYQIYFFTIHHSGL